MVGKKVKGIYQYLILYKHQDPQAAEHESVNIGYFNSDLEAYDYATAKMSMTEGALLVRVIGRTYVRLNLLDDGVHEQA